VIKEEEDVEIERERDLDREMERGVKGAGWVLG